MNSHVSSLPGASDFAFGRRAGNGRHQRLVRIIVILATFLATRPVALVPVGVGTVVCMVCAALLFILSGSSTAALLRRRPPIFLGMLVILAGTSIVWSQNRLSSVEGFFDLGSSLLICGGALSQIAAKRFLAAFQAGLVLSIIASVFCVFLYPGVGITYDGIYDGAWKGVTAHKNGLGMVALVSCLVAVIQIGYSKGKAWISLILLCDFYIAWKSQSTGALALMGVAMVFCVVGLSLSRRAATFHTGISIRNLFVIVLGVVVVLALMFWSEAIRFLGKDDTLASRGLIWQGALAAVAPWRVFGVGWGAALKIEGVLDVIAEYSHYDVTSTHNGLLYVLLGSGIVGVFMAFLCIVGTVFSLVRSMRVAPTEVLCLAGGYLVMLVGDLFETRLYQGVGWMYWCMTAVLLAAVPCGGRLLDSGESNLPLEDQKVA